MKEIWFGLFVATLWWAFSRGRLDVHIRYERNARRDCFVLRAALFGWLRIYRLRRESVLRTLLAEQWEQIARKGGGVAEKAAGAPRRRISSWTERLKRLNYTKLFVRRFVCRQFSCRIRIAPDDAGAAALWYGLAEAASRPALVWLERRADFRRPPELVITPDFRGGGSEVFFQCILSIKLGHIIAMLKKLYWEAR